jgi:hypothetical protein
MGDGGRGVGVKDGKGVGEGSTAGVIVADGVGITVGEIVGVREGVKVAASGLGVIKPGVTGAVAAGERCSADVELQALRQRSSNRII